MNTKGLYADLLPEVEEAEFDKAFLAMSKLRDRLVWRDQNIVACRVDEAIELLQRACDELKSKEPK